MIRDFKYHSANQSIRAVRCFISWRYWLRQVRERDDMQLRSLESGEGESANPTRRSLLIQSPDEKEDRSSPCRILIRLEGVEWIMYNRTMVFDDVLRKAQEASMDTFQSPNELGTSRNLPAIKHQVYRHNSAQVTEATTSSALERPGRYSHLAFGIPSRLWKWLMSLLPRFDFSDLLPIEFEAKKGAIILGNHSMKSRFIISFGSGTGTYGVAPVRIMLFEGSLHNGLFFSVARNTTNISNYTILTSIRSLSKQRRTKIIITTWWKMGDDYIISSSDDLLIPPFRIRSMGS